MRGAIALGLRLIGAGAGPGKLRTALMVLATCVGTVLMLVIAAIAFPWFGVVLAAALAGAWWLAR